MPLLSNGARGHDRHGGGHLAVAAWRTSSSARDAARDAAEAAERSADSAERTAAIDHERRLDELAPRFTLRYVGAAHEETQHLVEIENVGVIHERVYVGDVGWGQSIVEALAIEERISEPETQDGHVDSPGDTPCNSISLGRVEVGERCLLRVFEAGEHAGGEIRVRITTTRPDLGQEWSVTIGCGQSVPPAHRRKR